MGYKNALDALKEILAAEFLKESAVRDYAPGWEYKQVAVNERNHFIQELDKFITIVKDE